MFKLFNLKEDSEQVNDINVEIDEEWESTVEDVGQVALDVLDMDENLIIVAPLAWMDIEDINISVSKNVLTISGERARPEFYNEAQKVLVEECFFGMFSRSVILPENLGLNKIRANLDNNMLIIEIPKLRFDSKTIKINKLEG